MTAPITNSLQKVRDLASADTDKDDEFDDAEFTELLVGFQYFRSPKQESLSTACAYMAGLCSLLNPHVTRPRSVIKLCKKIAAHPTPHSSHFNSWETWLRFVLERCEDAVPESVQYTAMCFRIHCALILSNNIPLQAAHNRNVDTAFFSRRIFDTLQLLQRHPNTMVSVGARCFQANVAATLRQSHLFQDSSLFWSFVDAPKALTSSRHPNSLGDRATIIIIGLAKFFMKLVNTNKDDQKERRFHWYKAKLGELEIVIRSTIQEIDQVYFDSSSQSIVDVLDKQCTAMTKELKNKLAREQEQVGSNLLSELKEVRKRRAKTIREYMPHGRQHEADESTEGPARSSSAIAERDEEDPYIE